MRVPRPVTRLFVLAIFLLGSALPGAAQQQTGNLYGRVITSKGQVLPGATVTLEGQGSPQVWTTGQDGAFRFIGLSAGTYRLKVERENFTPFENRSISVEPSRNAEIEVTLLNVFETTAAGQIAESIVVQGESIGVDSRMVTKGVNIPREELEKIPTTRDPWAILQQTPGVLLDSVNVGGNESGKQPKIVTPGTDPRNTVWQIDGVAITDMVGSGSSSTYYDFDAFEAIEVSVGGADASRATAGATVNLVTKRGTNEARLSSRLYMADGAWQSDLEASASDFARPGPWNQNTAQQTFKQGNKVDIVRDYGIEGGGPLMKDHLWIWGSWGKQDVDLQTIDRFRDAADLENRSAKLSAQFTPSNSGSFFYHWGDNVRIGQNVGIGRPPETSWDRSSPTPIYKLQDNQIFNDRLYLTADASYVDFNFDLIPQGGGIDDPNFPNVIFDTTGIRHSYLYYNSDRPQWQAKLEGNYFIPAGKVDHELRFGAGYRRTDIESFSTWPGLQVVGFANQEIAPDVYFGLSATGSHYRDRIEANHAFLQDTVSVGNFTANIGLRYDMQTGENLAIHIDPAPVNQGVLIGGDFPAANPGFDWKSITPRLGLTYALGKNKDTLIQASYARFADQLDDAGIFTLSPGNPQYGYFYWYDYNGDRELTADEIPPFSSLFGVDPDNPGQRTVNEVAPGFDPPMTDELTLSVSHNVLPELVLGLSLTARQYSGVEELERLVVDPGSPAGSLGRPHRRDDYVVGWYLDGTRPDGQTFHVPVYRLKPGLTTFGGIYRENGDREQEYVGLSLTANKRLANHWLLRGHVTWNDWKWKVPESENEDPTLLLPGDHIDGSPVVIGSPTASGAKGNVFVNSGWSYDLSALYQIAPDRPWGFNVAVNVFGREGYPVPYSLVVTPNDSIGRRFVLIGDEVDEFRNPDLHLFSGRIDKELKFKDFALTLSLEGFNLTNESTVLQRSTAVSAVQTDVRTGARRNFNIKTSDYVTEVLSPRILRLGARLSWR